MQFQKLQLEGVGVRHFVDSNPAKQGLIKANSKQPDLNQLVGIFWYVAGKLLRRYWCQYVASDSNLADAPSRGNFSVMKQLGAQIIPADFSERSEAVEHWMSSMGVSVLVV